MNRSARSALPTCQRCLADLACVNRVTFTHRPTLRCRATLPAGAELSVVGVAYGLMRVPLQAMVDQGGF